MRAFIDTFSRRSTQLALAAAAMALALGGATSCAHCSGGAETPKPEPAPITSVRGIDGEVATVEHHDGSFNGLTIHYVTAGPENGKKVLLLHGFPEFWYGWRYQIAALAKGGYRVYAPDLRGFDLSSKPDGKDNYTIAKVAADIVEMIRGISPSAKIDLVGHDWGGSAAFRIAYDQTDLIDKLFILNIPHPNQIKDVLKKPFDHLEEAVGMLYIGAFTPKGQPEFLFKDLLGFQNSFNLFIYNPMVHKENITAEDRRIIYDSWSREGVMTAATNYYRVNFEFPNTFPDRPLPARLPVVLIFGMKDIFMSPSYVERIAQCTTCAENLTVYRENASHFVQSDVPREVNEILLKHLQ